MLGSAADSRSIRRHRQTAAVKGHSIIPLSQRESLTAPKHGLCIVIDAVQNVIADSLECIILSVNDTYMDAQEVMHMTDYSKITALYSRLSVGDEDRDGGESNSIQNQELLCKGWFLPPNTYDCGSFVVNETAVVGKEQNNPYNH